MVACVVQEGSVVFGKQILLADFGRKGEFVGLLQGKGGRWLAGEEKRLPSALKRTHG